MPYKSRYRIILYDPLCKYLSSIESYLNYPEFKITLILCTSFQELNNIPHENVSLYLISESPDLFMILDFLQEKSCKEPIILLKEKTTDIKKLASIEDRFSLIVDNDHMEVFGSYFKKIVSRNQPVISENFPYDISEYEAMSRLAENLDVVLVIFHADGKIAYVNRGFSRITGYLQSKVLGKLLTDFAHFESMDIIKSAFNKMSTGFNVPVMTVQLKTETKNTVFIEFSNVIISDRNGDTKYILSYGKDISFLINSKNEAEISKKFLEKIFSSINAEVLVLDRKYQIVKVNDRFRNHFPVDGSLTGKLCYSVIYGLDSPCHIYDMPCPVENIMSTFSEYRGESGDLRKDGQVWDIFGAPVFNKRGGIEDIVILRSDITEKKKAEARIKQDIQEKEVMLQEIHHRVNNNLQFMSSLISLELRNVENCSAKSRMEKLKNRIRIMSMIYNQLYYSPVLSEINLVEYIRNVKNEIIKWYGKRDVNFIFRADIKDLTINIDKAVPLGLILLELISNIFEHAFPKYKNSRKEAKIVLESSEENKLSLKVKDNGIGMPEELVKSERSFNGLYVAELLAQDQLEGELKRSKRAQKGTVWILKFRLK